MRRISVSGTNPFVSFNWSRLVGVIDQLGVDERLAFLLRVLFQARVDDCQRHNLVLLDLRRRAFARTDRQCVALKLSLRSL